MISLHSLIRACGEWAVKTPNETTKTMTFRQMSRFSGTTLIFDKHKRFIQ